MPAVDFTASKTCAQFMQSEAYGRLIAGPVGSGKTVSCVVELLRRCIQQAPGNDGIRHTRFAIVRQTLKQLKDTVLKDCNQWLSGLGEWRVSDSTYYINFQDVRSEWIFIPLEDAQDQARLLSMQLTGAWMSEAIEMNVDVLGPLTGRIGRYPSGADGAPSWFGIVADTNFPAEGTPWHKFMEEPTPDWQIFRQPSGLSEQAENLPHLLQTETTRELPVDHPVRIAQGRKYYQRLVNMHGIDSDFVRRYVKAEYGEDPSGTAVFRHCFSYSFHVVDDTKPIPGYPIIIAQDFGRDPWSVICQVDHMGRLVVHEEVAAQDTGLETHVQKSLKPRLMQEKYLGMKFAMVGDPSGRSKGTITEESCFDALKRMGIPAFPASTNDIDPRLRAVEALLLRQTNGGPTLMFNRANCPTLIRAMNGAYRYGKRRDGVRKPTPDKNQYSHVADALQYAALVAQGGMVDFITSRLTPRKRQKTSGSVTKGGWT